MSIIDPEWTPPVALPPLKLGDVHTWLFKGSFYMYHDNGEFHRAEHPASNSDQEQPVFAQNLLRKVLAVYLRTPPEDLRFFSNPLGRQFVSLGPGQINICFSIDHSGELVLIGVTIYKRIGIAIERIRSASEIVSIQASNSPKNHQHIRALKRAFLKAHGELDLIQPEELDMSQVISGIQDEQPIRLKSRRIAHPSNNTTGKTSSGIAGFIQKNIISQPPGSRAPRSLDAISHWKDPIEYKYWNLLSFHPGPGYIAGLVVEEDVRQILFLDGDRLEENSPV